METEFKSKFGKKVMFDNSYDCNTDTSIYYTAACQCGDYDHNTTIELEYDKELNMLSLNFYKDVGYFARFDYYEHDDVFLEVIRTKLNVIWKRIKDATRLLFTGYIEMNTDFILQDKQHIQDFIDAMIEGKSFCLDKNTSILDEALLVDHEPDC